MAKVGALPEKTSSWAPSQATATLKRSVPGASVQSQKDSLPLRQFLKGREDPMFFLFLTPESSYAVDATQAELLRTFQNLLECHSLRST